MKYIKLWGVGPMSQTRLFKWEWAVVYDYKTHTAGIVPGRTVAQTRSKARQFKREFEKDPRCSNVRLQRRLVAAYWVGYRDTFGYNAKGNGNGR